ncbi:hypothetical protein [Puia dinghuensis]|uniref:Uncharacterized protein n=1 Tax=Puia dinghuensis TaxID=1792502 RepID=A0A8J2U811_9BACT|nr:hypothetical protein [Puia dinghuensis]GGA84758.1 hypothetical protein GCM10011511_04740 [Puia dinghuensis]
MKPTGVNRYAPFVCLLLWSTGVFSQPNQLAKKDTLMWFVGTWQSKTVFKADSNYITGGAAGATVTVQPDGSTSIQSPDGQKFNQQIDQGLNAGDDALNNLKQQISSEGLGQYRLYTFTKEQIDSAKAWFQRLKLPDGSSSNSASPTPLSRFVGSLANYCETVKSDYDAVDQFCKAHRGMKHEHFDYPDPPKADYFNCWGCQHDAQKTFVAASQAYVPTFFVPEQDLVTKALAIMKNLQRIGRDNPWADQGPDIQPTIDSLWQHHRNDPSKNGPCEYLSFSVMVEDVVFLVQRMLNKADQLLDDVDKSNDYNAIYPAILVNLEAYRKCEQIGGFGSVSGQNNFERCRALDQKLFSKMADNLLSKHYWSYLASIPVLYEIAKEIQLLGGDANDNVLQQVNAATHFTLSLDLNAGLDFQGHGTYTTHLIGKARIVAEMDSISCIRFVLDEGENVISMHLEENRMSLQKCSPQYTGTYTYISPQPVLNIDLCKGAADTLTLARFSARPAKAGTWVDPCGGPPPASGINGVDGYFIDPNTVMKQAQNIKSNASANSAQMQDMIAKLKQQAAAIKQQFAGGGGGMDAGTATSIKKIQDMANTAMNSQISQLSRLVLPVTVTNNQTTLINQVIHATDINTNAQATQMIKYCVLTIQLKSTPQ